MGKAHNKQYALAAAAAKLKKELSQSDERGTRFCSIASALAAGLGDALARMAAGQLDQAEFVHELGLIHKESLTNLYDSYGSYTLSQKRALCSEMLDGRETGMIVMDDGLLYLSEDLILNSVARSIELSISKSNQKH